MDGKSDCYMPLPLSEVDIKIVHWLKYKAKYKTGVNAKHPVWGEINCEMVSSQIVTHQRGMMT